MIKRLLSLFLSLLLLALPARAEDLAALFFGETATPTATLPEITPTPTPAIPAAKLKDDGILRVYLKSLGDPQALHLTLSGNYALEGDAGFRFARDAEVALSADDGEIWLSAGGLIVNMGPALTLTRHAAEEGQLNGIYIDESERRALYCGDLSLTVASGGGLRPILTLPVEDYLMGVVAYEMSDSFPPEALKAQAVAARTYAMQRKWAAGKRDYDLVDTTADQVFKGYDPGLENVIAAVTATRGLVCIYDKGFATCYYTASNGGQTALPSQIWGGGQDADAYLAMTDDPYDLENPSSLENDLRFTAACEGSVKLRRMLVDALGDVMSEEGFDDWTLDAIAAIEPVSPRFEGSYLYDELAFDLRVKVPESALATPSPTASPVATPAGTPAMSTAPEPEKWVSLPDTRRVILPVFDDIKDGLSLGLNGSDCELVSVETRQNAAGEAESFRLVMRRFGHGVGMSQRGAQWMAGHYGKSFLDILAFYYPGVTVQRMDWPEHALEALDALPATVGAARPRPTPTPTPAPLPKLKAGERYAAVAASSLNVREQPTTASRVVDILDRGRRLIVSGPAADDGWVAVRTAEVEGYVREEYLEN